MIVLGIETSCDETAAAVVTDGAPDARILSNAIHSQIEDHAPYGGVVPEVAARGHVELIDRVMARALADAGVDWADVDGVAATSGPGLIGGVIVGAVAGQAAALARGVPFVAVNHLEAHALTARLTDDVAFPYLLLLASGGHCLIAMVRGVGRYEVLGRTLDDAIGEAFDKTAKLLGLGYPGGPAVEAEAQRATGARARFSLPRPMLGRPGCDFSLSGLKTAVRRHAEAIADLPDDDAADARADLCAAFLDAVSDIVADRLANAISALPDTPATLVVAGGVAANRTLRTRVASVAEAHGLAFVAPAPALCTDNAAMVAWAGLERLMAGEAGMRNVVPRPRWPLEEMAPPDAVAAGTDTPQLTEARP